MKDNLKSELSGAPDSPLRMYAHWLRYVAHGSDREPYHVVPVSCRSAQEYVHMAGVSIYEDPSPLEQLPSLMCPWPQAWFEYESKCFSEDCEAAHSGVSFASKVVMVSREDHEKIYGPLHSANFHNDVLDTVKNILHFETFNTFDGGFYKHPVVYAVYLSGEMGRYVGWEPFVPNKDDLDWWYQHDLENGGEVDRDVWFNEVVNNLAEVTFPMLLSIAWVHTNKTKVVGARFPKRETKLLDRGKIYKHYKIKIQAFQEQERIMEWHESTGKLPLHLVRGHFRDYRLHGVAGNPKARGIYWVPAHWRGNPGAGKVTKDYAVTNPDNVPFEGGP